MKSKPKLEFVKKPCFPNYPLKNKKRISGTLIAWVNDINHVKKIYGVNEKDLVKEARSFLKTITPKGCRVESSLWRKGKIISKIKFLNKG